MSSVASGMNAEKTNRWLLIGAAVLAVVAGALVFAALANFGSDDESGGPGVGPDTSVLVANRTIGPNTKVSEAMFDRVTVAESAMVEQAATEPSAVIGKVTRSEIIKGQQISVAQLSLSDETRDDGLAEILASGKVGFTIGADEISIVAGFVQAGDRVNIIGVFRETRGAGGDGDNEITRVETLLQNIEVLAVAQAPVDAVSSVNAEGTPIASTGSAVGSTASRPDDVEPNPGAGSITLHLTPQESQLLAAARDRGELFLSLRPLGEEEVIPVDPQYFDEFGPLPLLPRR